MINMTTPDDLASDRETYRLIADQQFRALQDEEDLYASDYANGKCNFVRRVTCWLGLWLRTRVAYSWPPF